MQKEQRQRKILSLIRAKRIGTQEELTAHLERAGVPATQSSVSRDLRGYRQTWMFLLAYLPTHYALKAYFGKTTFRP